MATTAVVAEILIVGLETTAWLWLLVAGLFGREVVPIKPLADSGALGLLAVVATAYILGVLTDRIADSLYKQLRETPKGKEILKNFGGKDVPTKESVATMRLRMMSLDDGRSRFLEYQRSRWRIARATLLNLVCALPTSVLFIVVRTEVGFLAAAGIVSLLVTGIALSLYASEKISTAYVKRLRDSYQMWRSDQKDE